MEVTSGRNGKPIYALATDVRKGAGAICLNGVGNDLMGANQVTHSVSGK